MLNTLLSGSTKLPQVIQSPKIVRLNALKLRISSLLWKKVEGRHDIRFWRFFFPFVVLSQSPKKCRTTIMAVKKNTRRKAKTGKDTLNGQHDDAAAGFAGKTERDNDDNEEVDDVVEPNVVAGAKDDARIASGLKAANSAAGKSLSLLDCVGRATDIQGPYGIQGLYSFLLLLTNTAVVRHPRWGETDEELRASINFETPDDEDAYGNKLSPVENLAAVFENNYHKVYAAVDQMTGEFKECEDMTECDNTVHWTLKLTGTKMVAMVFEGKNSLMDFTNKIKQSKAAANPRVSCQPRLTSSGMALTDSRLTSHAISHFYNRHRPSSRLPMALARRPRPTLP